MTSTLEISYLTLTSLASSYKVYWTLNGDGSYDAWVGTDRFFAHCSILGENIAPFEADLKNEANLVASKDDALVLSDQGLGNPRSAPQARPIRFGNMPQRSGFWSWFEPVAYTKGLVIQYEEDADTYTVYGYDGPEALICTIWKGSVPSAVIAGGYTQEQNDNDKDDFEDNYKAAANWTLDKREKDGRSIIRISTAVPGRRYRLRTFYFKTSLPSSLRNGNAGDGEDLGDVVMKCYDDEDEEIAGPDFSGAVKTTLAFEALEDIEMIGGWMDIDTSLTGGTTDEWWISVLAAPDIPAEYGGNIDYVNEANMEMIVGSRISMDGRASAVVQYDGVYHSGKLLFIIKHPAGGSKRFQIYLEHFR